MLVYLDNFQSMSPDAKLPNPRQMRRQAAGQRRPGAQGGGFGNPRLHNPNYRDQQNDREMQRDQMTPEQQRQARAPNGLRNRKPGINENYAREIMELHTLGVEGGYTQKDVQEVARCLTGWTLDRPRQGTEFVFRPFMHDNGEKTVLGHKIPAGGGIKDGEMVIDILAHHPSTAKFISTKLARRFVSDTPPQALVDRVASVYTKTDGDIREMLRTIVTSPEFHSKEAHRAKIKSPFELAVSAVRALSADVTIASANRSVYLEDGPAALSVSSTDRLSGQGRPVGEHGVAARTAELRPRAYDKQSGRRVFRCEAPSAILICQTKGE
jgi:uncharacterized protein (DUF1800 family)